MSQIEDNLVVKRGMRVGFLITILMYSIAYILVPKFQQEIVLLDRIKLGLESLVIPALFFLVLILRVGSMRYGNDAEDPTKLEASSKNMQIELRILSNTDEQIIVFLLNTFGLCLFLPFQYLSLVPIYSALFIVGRIVYWAGYHHNVLWRAPGFGMAVLPALLGLLYCSGCIVIRLF